MVSVRVLSFKKNRRSFTLFRMTMALSVANVRLAGLVEDYGFIAVAEDAAV